MQNTAENLTHKNIKSNFFTVPNSNIARSGFLEKIQFTQWHVFDDLRDRTKNINVINLASLIAVMPRMGIYSYEIPQAEIAEKMAMLFKMTAPPARNTISKWEHELEKMGFLEIPSHVDWRASKTKIRVITKKFWHLARRGKDYLSYTCPPVTFCAGKVDKVIQVILKKDLKSDPVVKIRACETKIKPVIPSRAISEKLKFSRPPKPGKSIPKRLSKFENSVMFWLFQNKNLVSYREGVILFARFLEMGSTDDYYRLLETAWQDCRDAARPGLVSDMIRNMRSVESVPLAELQAETVPPLQAVMESIPRKSDDPELPMLRNALVFGAPYAGKYPGLVSEFKSATPDRQDEIILGLSRGEIRC
jgi:hypothetical protein